MLHRKSQIKGRKRKKRDIFLIDKSFKIVSKERDTSILLLVIQTLLIIAGVYGVIFSFIEAFKLNIHKEPLYVAIIISVIFYSELLRRPKLGKSMIPLSTVIYLIVGFKYREKLLNGLLNIDNSYIREFNQYYKTGLFEYLVGNYKVKDVITIFMIFVVVVVALLACSAVFSNILRILFVFLTILILLLPFTVGIIPNPLPFAAYLVFVIDIKGMSATLIEKTNKDKKHHFESKEGEKQEELEQNINKAVGLKIGGILSVILLSLFCIISFFFTPQTYAETVKLEVVKATIEKEAKDFYLSLSEEGLSFFQMKGAEFFQRYSSLGGLGAGKLGRVDEVVYHYVTALRVTMPVIASESYLKGYVGSVYSGDSWEGLTKEDQDIFEKIAELWKGTDFQINNQSSYFLSLIKDLDKGTYESLKYSKSNIKVEAVNANRKYYYAPYYSDYPVDNSKNLNNTKYVIPKSTQTDYDLSYYNNYISLYTFDAESEYKNFLDYYKRKDQSGSLSDKEKRQVENLTAYYKYEAIYRDFVYKTYTKVPEKGLERIKADFGKYNYEKYRKQYGYEALVKLTDLVKKYLYTNTSYTLKPGNLPKGKDFAQYFLYENKVGYCTHYASAAAIIFRTMGIPARYVEGYVVKPKDLTQGKEIGKTTISGRLEDSWKEYDVINKTIEIQDTNAHSWVEVYIDGFGWVPVDVTPSDNNAADSAVIAKNMKKEVTTSAPIEKPLVNDSSVKTNNDRNTKDILKTQKNGNTKGISNNKLTYIWKVIITTIIKIVILILSFIFVIAIRAIFIRISRKKAFGTKNASHRVILRYKEIRRILTFYHIPYPENDIEEKGEGDTRENRLCSSKFTPLNVILKTEDFKRFTEIALKAKFDNKWVSEEESEAAEKFYKNLIDSIYQDMPLLKKIIQKFLMVF